jgi:hypothetical protein
MPTVTKIKSETLPPLYKGKVAKPGIVRFAAIPAKFLKRCHNPLNWKNHTPRQQRAIKASLEKHGWSGVLLYNEVTGHLVDGHGRTDILHDGDLCHVGIGRWTPAQERSLLASLDPIGSMAETDPAALRKLTDQISKDTATLDSLTQESEQTYAELTAELNDHAASIEFGDSASFFPENEEDDDDGDESDEKESDDEEGSTSVRTSNARSRQQRGSTLQDSFQLSQETGTIQQYKTRDNIAIADWQPVAPFDIPSLRKERCGSVDSALAPWVPSTKQMPKKGLAFYIWGTGTIGIDWSRTIINFYTADRRFESCWNNPDTFTAKVMNARPYALVAPNFSIWEGTSRAEEIYQIYRTRFVARYWQEAGLDIIPDIQLGNLWGSDAWNWRFLGIPVGLPCIAVNLQTPGSGKLVGKGFIEQFFASRLSRLKSVLKILKPQQLLIYHGTRFPESFTRALPKSLDVVLCRSHMSDVIDSRKDAEGKQR